MAKEIEVIARGAVIRSGRVLLCQNVKHQYFYLPGGHVEFGEPAAVALAREFLEETATTVSVRDCALVAECSFEQGGKRRHELNLVFHVEPSGAPESLRSVEPKIAFVWVDLAAVQDLDIRPEPIKAWLACGAPRGRVEWVPIS